MANTATLGFGWVKQRIVPLAPVQTAFIGTMGGTQWRGMQPGGRQNMHIIKMISCILTVISTPAEFVYHTLLLSARVQAIARHTHQYITVWHPI